MPKREAIKSIMESNVITNVQTIQDVVKQVVDLKSVDKEIIDLVKSTLYTKNGTHAEEGIRNKFESAVKTKVNTFTRFKTSDLPIAKKTARPCSHMLLGAKNDRRRTSRTLGYAVSLYGVVCFMV